MIFPTSQDGKWVIGGTYQSQSVYGINQTNYDVHIMHRNLIKSRKDLIYCQKKASIRLISGREIIACFL